MKKMITIVMSSFMFFSASGIIASENNESKHLQYLNQSLSRQIESLNLPIPVSTTYPELLNEIDALPTAFINMQLAQIFDEEYLKQIKDPHQFSKELVNVALRNNNGGALKNMVSIHLSSSPISGIRMMSSVVELDRYDSIYVHVKTQKKCAGCIIKWRYLNEDNIILFKPLSLQPDKKPQYVWLKSKKGWKIGSYQVTVHDMDNQKKLVASHSFQISRVTSNKSVNTPDYDVINDLVVDGQAVPKTY